MFKKLSPLLLLIFLDSFSYFLVIPVLLQLFYQPSYGILGADVAQSTRNILMGCAIAGSTFVALFISPFVGSFSDKYGRKKTLLICLGFITVGFILPIIGILQKSIVLIFVGRLLGGIGSSSQPVAQAAVADLCDGKEKSYYFSLIALMMTLPLILGPLAGGYLSDSHFISWFTVTTPYYASAILSVLTFIIVGFGFHESLKLRSRPVMLGFFDIITGFKKLSTHKGIGTLLVIFFAMELAWSAYYQSISTYLSQSFHYAATSVSLFSTYMGLLMCVGLLFLYPIFIRTFSLKKIIRFSLILVSLGFLICAIGGVPLYQWIAMPLVCIFVGAAYVSLLSQISNTISPEHQGWIMGYASTILYAAWMFTGFASGFLLSFHALLPLIFSAVLSLVAVLVAVIPAQAGIHKA